MEVTFSKWVDVLKYALYSLTLQVNLAAFAVADRISPEKSPNLANLVPKITLIACNCEKQGNAGRDTQTGIGWHVWRPKIASELTGFVCSKTLQIGIKC